MSKKLNIKKYAPLGALLLVSIFGVGVFIVNGYSGQATTVVEGDLVVQGDFNPPPQVEQTVGGFPSPDIYQHLNLHAGFTTGGSVYATDTTASTYTLTSTEFGEDTIALEVVPIRSMTFTLPASTTMYNWIPNVGDTRRVMIHNYATDTATITVAAGDTMLLQYATDTLAFNASTTMVIDFTRVNAWDNGAGTGTSTADIVGIIDVFGPAY